ncbi:MAG: hydroxyacylglutathione hydrolase [Mesorhizobium sp.]|uniref:FAD/NAD(P)-binding protein n=1 Tax=Mesorhizobium sp. TaxID=1871066 RepID=UPI000FE4383A|nr:FAD/NAD(P)-binding protein [Mesorhizobium sp.]RWH67914.1 MAG: hydroxyacylglutathione hydrolase [Mesorhizobium sp.]RWH76398.1 MAG: hydroxyacylglutathione hydrolase [Mesorhizobium sp.]RWH83472.1 MAG: hydroxyacylglutathione hydrolase [Mesorhizobium sp.]RWH91489.1 MAG: hydroxyacylglutathione hydrolase [Mesorhizobium sp.]RWI11946.1 MAG: hydroxyacylglutathione hydrolase [Mesorhizobium sp.]
MSARDLGRGPVVAIIGGGFSGAATAFHLARLLPAGAADIVVVEPREGLGYGLAYSTADPSHRINVPASRMTLISGQDSHFADWLEQTGAILDDAEAIAANGALYPQRRVFGRYVESYLQPFLSGKVIRHVRSAVASVELSGQGYILILADGRTLAADALVIAATHPPPALPSALRSVAAAARLVANPYDLGGLQAIGRDDHVLVVGTGLTSADIIATLDRNGHRSRILALSRHGYRSRSHAVLPVDPIGDFISLPSRSATVMLRRIRATILDAKRRGEDWHPVLDAVRRQGQIIWQALPLDEQRRLVRHLRTLWDVHRFRIAPQVADVLDRRVAEGMLAYRAASIVGAEQVDGRIRVTLRPRRQPTQTTETFDRVVVTTGPAHADIFRTNTAIADLGRMGLVRLDPIGLGLETDSQGRALSTSGRPTDSIFVSGPLARGSVGELMGIPEVTAHAERIAAEIHQWLGYQTALRRKAS